MSAFMIVHATVTDMDKFRDYSEIVNLNKKEQ